LRVQPWIARGRNNPTRGSLFHKSRRGERGASRFASLPSEALRALRPRDRLSRGRVNPGADGGRVLRHAPLSAHPSALEKSIVTQAAEPWPPPTTPAR